MYCANCGTEVQEGWKACPKCGTKIPVIESFGKEQVKLKLEKKNCKKCGAELREDWVKCPFCGQLTGETEYTNQNVIQRQYRETTKIIEPLQMEKDNSEVNSTWSTKKVIIVLCIALLIICAGMLIWKVNFGDSKPVVEQTEVKTLEDVGGYEAWVESGYAAKIRTDIVVMLPVTKRQSDDYAVRIGSSFGDIIFIKQKDGTMATEWNWLMNAVSDIEDGDTATFQATLSLDGYVAVEGEKPVPKFIAEDIKSYSGEVWYQEFDSEKGVEENTVQGIPDIIDADYEFLYGGVMDRIVSDVYQEGGFVEYLHFAYYDIDKDGYLEFIMENGTCDADMKFEVFSTKDGESIFKVGEGYGVASSLYGCPEYNGFYTDYGHTDYETVTYVYIKNGKLKQEVVYDNIYTQRYGYINGVAMEELKYPIEVYTLGEFYDI